MLWILLLNRRIKWVARNQAFGWHGMKHVFTFFGSEVIIAWYMMIACIRTHKSRPFSSLDWGWYSRKDGTKPNFSKWTLLCMLCGCAPLPRREIWASRLWVHVYGNPTPLEISLGGLEKLRPGIALPIPQLSGSWTGRRGLNSKQKHNLYCMEKRRTLYSIQGKSQQASTALSQLLSQCQYSITTTFPTA